MKVSEQLENIIIILGIRLVSGTTTILLFTSRRITLSGGGGGSSIRSKGCMARFILQSKEEIMWLLEELGQHVLIHLQ